MNKYMKFLVLLFVLVGCNQQQKPISLKEKTIEQANLHKFNKICLDGHVYYEWNQHIDKGGIAPVFDEIGRPKRCGHEH